MAFQVVCDGCGKAQNGTPFTERGFVKKGLYCESCAEFVDDLLLARDEVHTALAEQWQDENEILRKKFKKQCPDGRFPDE